MNMKQILLKMHGAIFEGEEEMPFESFPFLPDNARSKVSIIIFAPNVIELSRVKKWLIDSKFEDQESVLTPVSYHGMLNRFLNDGERRKVILPSLRFEKWLQGQKHLCAYSRCQVYFLNEVGFPYIIKAIVLADTAKELQCAARHLEEGKRNNEGLTRKSLSTRRLVESWSW